MPTSPRYLPSSPLARRLGIGAGSKLSAELAGRGFQFLLVYLAQRSLGPAAYGRFAYALAAGFVLSTLTDLGLQLTVTREISRDGAGAARITGTGLAVKLALALAAAGLLAGFSLTRPSPERLPMLVVGLAMICISFVQTLGYVFLGLQRVEHEAVLLLFMRLAIVGLGVATLAFGGGVLGLALAYLGGGALAAAGGFLWLTRRFFPVRLVVAPAAWWGLLRQALPLGGAIAFSAAYTRTAVFLLEGLHGSEAVGLFAMAQRLTEPMAIVPAALMAAVFPALAERLALGGGRAGRLARWSVVFLALAGGAVAAGGFIGGPWLIDRLYGAPYDGSKPALQILSLAAAPIFVNYALTHFMVALDRQTLNLMFNAILFCVNAALCAALIPHHGATGAAAALLASELLLLALCSSALYAHRRTT